MTMTPTTEQTHVRDLIPDYVLGVLPGDRANWVVAHTSHCGPCRRALAHEQEIGRSVKDALTMTARVDRERLRSLMPPVPTGARVSFPRLSPALATAAVMLVLLFGVVALFAGQRPGSWGLSAPTALSTAVMLTDTPTQTATREMTATAEGQEAVSNPAPAKRAAANKTFVPAPALVPIPAASALQ
jgi:anti-sigma factor RsiW